MKGIYQKNGMNSDYTLTELGNIIVGLNHIYTSSDTIAFNPTHLSNVYDYRYHT